MDPEVLAFAQVAAIIVGLVGSLAMIGVVVVRAIKRPVRLAPLGNSQVDQRLDQLQQSVDAIAVEVERIAEAQRFSAKLLAERTESST